MGRVPVLGWVMVTAAHSHHSMDLWGPRRATSLKDARRRTALVHRVPYFTTVAGAVAAAKAIEALKNGSLDVKPIQEYYHT